jgi:hypothetical protein
MATIDASIPLRAGAGVQPVDLGGIMNNALALQSARQQGQMNALAMQERQGQMERQNRLRNTIAGLPGDATDDQRIGALRQGGFFDEADKLETGILNRKKTEAEVGSKRAETLGKQLDAMKFLSQGVMANPTPQNATLAIDAFERLTGTPMTEERQKLLQLTTPEQVKAWAAGHALTADKLLPQIQTRNTGATTDTLAIDPLTGQPRVTGSVRNTVSPDAQLQANVTMRGQNMTNERAREANTIARGGKVAENETALRKEFADLPEVKNLKAAFPAFAAVRDAATRNNSQADINLIYGLAKLYDPTSVVREGEYATIANSQAIPEWLKSQAQRLAGGGRLTPETKRQILTEAEGRIASFEQQYTGAQQTYQTVAQRRGLNPENIFTPVGREAEKKSRADVARVANDADYDRLPSGAVFVGPDGVQRRKP